MTSVVFLMVAFLCISPSWTSEDKKDCVYEEFTCPAPTGDFADPCTCRRFYTCTDNNAYKKFCPSGLFWDDVDKRCKFKSEAVCGPVVPKRRKKPTKVEIEDKAEKCDPKNDCRMPFCYCTKQGIKGPVPDNRKKDVTQFVTITIDGAINNNNFEYYMNLINTKENLKLTFFIEHPYCDYYQVERLYAMGHEIAITSVTGELLDKADLAMWKEEISTMKSILQKYANVNPDDIVGVRAPKLKSGHNVQYEALVQEQLIWDSSVATTALAKPVWPYTLDYRIPHPCKFDSCPTKSFPGVWEIPVNAHFVKDGTGGRCSHLDQCLFTFQTSDDVFAWLKEDFARHYEGTRAPYMLSVHTNWFLSEHQFEGLKKFIRWSSELPDVFYGTMTELMLWMTDPNLYENPTLKPSSIGIAREISCSNPNSCELPFEDKNGLNSIRYMRTCNTCPYKYPWLKVPDDENENEDEDDEIE